MSIRANACGKDIDTGRRKLFPLRIHFLQRPATNN